MKGNERIMQSIAYFKENKVEVVFGLYFLAALLASILNGAKSGIILFGTLSLYAVWTLVPKIHRLIGKISFVASETVFPKDRRNVFALASLITFGIFFLWFLGCYPGSFSPDSISQYTQAVTGNYNDWHPAWHTLLFFTIPLKITGGWTASIVLFQILLFSLLAGYFALTVFELAGRRYMIISTAFIVLNPYSLQIVMYPWKDVAFAMAAACAMLYAVRIYATDGAWCSKIRNLLLLSFMLVSATLFRHNGILFTFFLLFALFFFMPKKRWLLLTTMLAVLFAGIKLPLYSCLKVEKPGGRTQESMGLPLSVIVNVAKTHPNTLNEETALFVDELMTPQPDWKSAHSIYGFNSVKFRGVNTDVIEEKGAFGIMCMMFHCFISAPFSSLRAILGLTIPVYGDIPCSAVSYINENSLGIVYRGISPIRFLSNRYFLLFYKSPLRYVFLCIGSTILVMLAFVLFKTDFKNRADWKRILLCVPVFTYNFGTMLLLSGPDVRFFYVSFLVCPLVVLIMGMNRKQRQEEIKIKQIGNKT